MKISDIARNLSNFMKQLNSGLPTAKQMHDRISESRRPNTDPPPAPPARQLSKLHEVNMNVEMPKCKPPRKPVTIKLPPDPNAIHIDDLMNKTIIDNDGNEFIIMGAKIEENPHLHPYKTLTASLIKPFDLAK
jgi:hypothetical protein